MELANHLNLGRTLFHSWRNRHFMGLRKSLHNFLNRILYMDVKSCPAAKLLVLAQKMEGI